MGSIQPFTIIEGPEAWTAEQHKNSCTQSNGSIALHAAAFCLQDGSVEPFTIIDGPMDSDARHNI
jgi:hypothetical protein